MITLTTLSTYMSDKLFGATYTAVPTASQTEAIRLTLAQINADFTADYTISELDDAVDTTLPETFVSAVLLGASAFILDFTIRSRLVTYMNTPTLSDPLVDWARKMKEEFHVSLDRLRLDDLQQATNSPAFQIPEE